MEMLFILCAGWAICSLIVHIGAVGIDTPNLAPELDFETMAKELLDMTD